MGSFAIQQNNKLNFRDSIATFAFCCALLFNFAGCTRIETFTGETVTIQGNAMLGPVKNANVVIYPILPSGQLEVTRPLGFATTDASGNYELKIPNQDISGSPAAVQITGGSYREESSGNEVALKGRTITAIIPKLRQGSQIKVAVGPLTEIAYQVFKSRISVQGLQGRTLAGAINNSNFQVSQAFGLYDILGTIPSQPSGLVSNDANGQYTVVLATLSSAAHTANTDSAAFASAYAKLLIQNGNFSKAGIQAVSATDAAGKTVSLTPPSFSNLLTLSTQLTNGTLSLGGVQFTSGLTPPSLNPTPPTTAPANYPTVDDSTSGPSAPGVPLNVSAVAGNTNATVTFSAPASDGGSTITGYTVTSNPPGGNDANAGSTSLTHSISGLTNGTSYTFTVRATNAIGSSAASSSSNSVIPNAAPTAPGAPTNLIAVAGDAQATLSFKAPASNGGSAITGYTVTSSPVGGIDANSGSTSLSHTITGLTNGTTYIFSVIATNAIGSSASSIFSNSVMPMPVPTAPGAPTSVVAVAGDAQASVSFSPPSSNGNSAIIGYTVTSSPAGGVDINAGSTSTSHTMTGLTNGTSYSFTVKAMNVIGTSSSSAPSNSVIPFALTAPSAPTNVSASAGDAQASVSFIAPSSNGGSAIIGYTVTSSPAGGVDANAGSTSLAHSITGLSNGTTYSFSVKATNAIGSSVASASSNSVTPTSAVTVPSPPTNVVASAGDAQASISFNTPVSNGGSAIIGYSVTSIPAGGVDINAGSTSLFHSVTGLINGTSYIFTVRAFNAVGGSAASLPSSSVTPIAAATVPSEPTNISATGGDSQASISFIASASNGGSSITGYSVTSIPAGGLDLQAGSTSLFHTVVGLTNGTSYIFTVKATNGVGASIASAPSNSIVPGVPPSAPTNAVATAGNSEAFVTFNAPSSDGGSAITGYTVTSSPSGVDINSNTLLLTHNIKGLTNGTSYTFTVKAKNVLGQSLASSVSNAIVPASVPDAPTNPVATASSTQASVSFTTPSSDGGSPITGYTVTSSPTGGVDANAGSTSLTHSITGLTNGTAYSFTVKATNTIGTSAASSASNSVTPAPAISVPGAPTNVTAVAASGQATVSFTAPASNGGSSITGYTVTSNTGLTANGAASPITITGLLNGATYTFTVAATNSAGTGPASAASTGVTTPASVPGAPTIGKITTNLATGTGSIAFTPPASNGGSTITSYKVTSSGGPSTLTATGTSSPISLTGLSADTLYTFTVTATNAIGTGPASAPSPGVTCTNQTLTYYMGTDSVIYYQGDFVCNDGATINYTVGAPPFLPIKLTFHPIHRVSYKFTSTTKAAASASILDIDDLSSACTPGQTISCSLGASTGVQTCNGTGTAYGTCKAANWFKCGAGVTMCSLPNMPLYAQNDVSLAAYIGTKVPGVTADTGWCAPTSFAMLTQGVLNMTAYATGLVSSLVDHVSWQSLVYNLGQLMGTNWTAGGTFTQHNDPIALFQVNAGTRPFGADITESNLQGSYGTSFNEAYFHNQFASQMRVQHFAMLLYKSVGGVLTADGGHALTYNGFDGTHLRIHDPWGRIYLVDITTVNNFAGFWGTNSYFQVINPSVSDGFVGYFGAPNVIILSYFAGMTPVSVP